MWGEWKPYVPVAERRRRALREAARLMKKGQTMAPVVIEGRTIASTFWGKAWCDNLERYSDYENRLPRGRTYARNGSVIDLQIGPAEVKALVSGSSMYRVAIQVTSLPRARWKAICRDCSGAIDSLVELLQGHMSGGVMERICRDGTGLFPAPAEIEFSCSCPDWASMCKHVAAVLYGIGARLDHQPELLFALRKVDQKELITHAGTGVPLSRGSAPASGRVLADDGLSELFGLDLDVTGGDPPAASPASGKRSRARAVAPSATGVRGKRGRAEAPAARGSAAKRGRAEAPAARASAAKRGRAEAPASAAKRGRAEAPAARASAAKRGKRGRPTDSTGDAR
jgi:hypothetical protein